MNPSNSDDLYRAFVGDEKAHHYLPVFGRFDEAGRAGVSWHWPAFFFTLFWLLRRKLWGYAVAYFFLPGLLSVLLSVVDVALGANGRLATPGAILILVAVWVLPPLFAHALYYRRTNAAIAQVRRASPDEAAQLAMLRQMGGTSWAPLLVLLVPLIGILAAIALPAYQDYVIRAKVAEVGERVRGVAHEATMQRESLGRWPDELAPIPDGKQGTRAVLTQDPQTGVIEAAISDVNQALNGKHIVFEPVQGDDGQLRWTCYSDDLKAGALPKWCRTEP